MNPNLDSIYPAFFQAGIGALKKEGSSTGDFLALFSALEEFRRGLNTLDNPGDILRLTQAYIEGLGLFKSSAFYLLNPEDYAFELAACSPESERVSMEDLVGREIRSGKFAWALRQTGPAFFHTRLETVASRGVFHSMTVASHAVGMFCGLLRNERVPRQEITFSLLTILLGAATDAIAAVRTTAELRHKILLADRDLHRMFNENKVLARFPSENPSPMLRIALDGRILYSNAAGSALLDKLGFRVNDILQGPWREALDAAGHKAGRCEFEAEFDHEIFNFAIVTVPEAQYANFYGSNITARKRMETEREKLIGELQEALGNIKTLHGLLPICAWCKKIRDDSGYWKQLESYVESHSQAVFSHGVCPDCLKKISAEL
jgi:hypothetical protein